MAGRIEIPRPDLSLPRTQKSLSGGVGYDGIDKKSSYGSGVFYTQKEIELLGGDNIAVTLVGREMIEEVAGNRPVKLTGKKAGKAVAPYRPYNFELKKLKGEIEEDDMRERVIFEYSHFISGPKL
jgi:hypothetical protein